LSFLQGVIRQNMLLIIPMISSWRTPGEWAECGGMYKYKLSFFIKMCEWIPACFSDRKGEIHEINTFWKRSEFPGKFTIRIHDSLEGIPVLEVDNWVWMVLPEADAVV
jgi:hypothetical protein